MVAVQIMDTGGNNDMGWANTGANVPYLAEIGGTDPTLERLLSKDVTDTRELSREERFQLEAMPHLDSLFSTAARLMGERSRAEDVVQEVFLHAWKSFDRFEAGTNCRAWLYKILFHCVIHHRRRWFRIPLVKDSNELIDIVAGPPAPLPQGITDAEILRALDAIPEDFRASVLLVDVEEFSYKEAAEILGVPIGTVMSRLSRGRRLLRAKLSDLAQSYGIGKIDQKGVSA